MRASHRPALKNWATNIQFRADTFARPKTIEQLQEIVQKARRVRVVGAGHSFNDIANTEGTLISLGDLDKQVIFDHDQRTATVHAGMTYIDVAPILDKAGYALANLSSTPHTTIIGACMTGTHGSGDSNKILADQVAALELIKADGERVTVSRAEHGDKFNGMVVALGGLGVVARVTLDLVPAYMMQHEIYRRMPMAALESHFDALMAAAYSVSLGTRWQNEIVDLVLMRRKLVGNRTRPVPETYHGGELIGDELYANYPMERITFSKNGVAGPWYERLPFFNIRSTITGTDERQSEYFVHRDQAVAALMAVKALGPEMASFIKLTEIRTMAADEMWLSPAYKQACVGIHFSWFARQAEIETFLPRLEQALAPFKPRPHWGKMFAMAPADVMAGYERMGDFQALLAEYDPQGKFRNDYLARYASA